MPTPICDHGLPVDRHCLKCCGACRDQPTTLDGWLLIDSESTALLVTVPSTSLGVCDACITSNAVYGVEEVGGDVLICGFCHECLDQARLDPTSPDRWFQPFKPA